MALAQLPPEQVQAYHQDRAESLRTRPLSGFAETRATLALYLQRLQQMLAGGQPFLLGDAVSLADVCCFHPLWILRMVPPISAVLDGSPLVLAWMDRVKHIGHGRLSELSATDALAIARNGPPPTVRRGAPQPPARRNCGGQQPRQLRERRLVRLLELKLPPPFLALLLAAAMWGVSHFEPRFAIPATVRWSVAVVLALVGATFDVLGLLFVLLGWAVFLGSLWPFLAPMFFVPYVDRFQIKPEELAMARLFGESYATYTAKVPRWL